MCIIIITITMLVICAECGECEPAQESADIVWCNWDASGLCGPSPQPPGKLCLCAAWIL